jgi:hypothetical protein
MMGRQDRDQASLFYEFRLDDMIPKGHLLRRINVFVTSVKPELAVLTPELIELLAFRRRQPVAATAGVALGLADPVSDRLRRWFKLLRQLLGRAADA